MEQKKEIKRGEMWFISPPNSNPAGQGLGRPAVVMSNPRACENAPEIAAVYVTTNMAKNGLPENALLTSPARESMARCNGVPLIPRPWFQYKMCDITPYEMNGIEKALFYGLGLSVEDELRSLKRQLAFHKALYREALEELARKQLAEDLADELYLMHPPTVELPVTPVEPEPAPVESPELKWTLTPEEQLLALELEALEAAENTPDEPEEDEPAEPEEDEPELKPPIDVNRLNWWQLHRKLAVDQDTAKEIIGERTRLGGRFRSAEEFMKVCHLKKKDIKKIEGRIVFE